ncbi:MAG: hypothetical protein Rubg2KO_33810 [Rubricoccaceae bacterium]
MRAQQVHLELGDVALRDALALERSKTRIEAVVRTPIGHRQLDELATPDHASGRAGEIRAESVNGRCEIGVERVKAECHIVFFSHRAV